MSEISFSFDDKVYKGNHGEPMAAALLRNGFLSFTDSTYHGVHVVLLVWVLKNPTHSFS